MQFGDGPRRPCYVGLGKRDSETAREREEKRSVRVYGTLAGVMRRERRGGGGTFYELMESVPQRPVRYLTLLLTAPGCSAVSRDSSRIRSDGPSRGRAESTTHHVGWV